MIDAFWLNLIHHFVFFISFVYWLKTDDAFISFGIMATSIIVGYFLCD